MKRGQTDVRYAVDGVPFVATVAARVCNGCGQEFIEANVLRRFELGVAMALVEMGRCTPEAFRFMRKAMGLSGVALAELLGVKAESVSRWENGARALDRGAFALLGGLVADRIEGRTDTTDRLKALRSPKKLPKRALRIELPRTA